MKWTGKPGFVFEMWAKGMADLYVADDKDLPVSQLQRLFWRVRGEVVCFLFGWWWWGQEAQ